ncbi:MAG: ornithine cyclodeaminase family protein, partial [Actinomycetota bacterium]|nr:ornithine cyclodeaminase family protein [Actinomycetota bacterium]
MLIIDNATVAELLGMAECIDAQEEAFRRIPDGGTIHRPRLDMYVPCDREDGYYRWGTMEGADHGILAIRMKSDVITWPELPGGGWREDKYCVEPGTYCGLIFLLSTRNGEPLAFINDGVLQHMRVGGGAGIGARHLARADARTVGILGSGGMARTYLEAFTTVRPINRVTVYSPTVANRESFAREMSEKFGIDVVPVSTAREAVRGVDILATCTDSMHPTFEADWLERGMHVTMLGPREISQEVLDRCDVKIRQGAGGLRLTESERVQGERGHSPMAYIAGTVEEMRRLPAKGGGGGFGGDYPDYCDLVTGRVAGRESDDQITFYHNIGNQGLQFSSVGGLVYRKAEAAG